MYAMDNRSAICSLPTEIQLCILQFLSTPSLLNFTQTSKHWHSLIDDPSQDERIYRFRTEHPSTATDFSFLQDTATSFTHYYANVTSWKDLHRRQTTLSRNWVSQEPAIRESIIRPDDSRLIYSDEHIWRFRPDFQRRFILCTAQSGGLTVFDMDSSSRLFHLHVTIVHPYAHLEYSNGYCAFNSFDNSVEIWWHAGDSSESNEHKRGTFVRACTLPHDVVTRGFQLTWPILCVVSEECLAFVYDLTETDHPVLIRKIDIPLDVVGHLDQAPFTDTNALVISLGYKGYIFYDKSTGARLGTLDPKTITPRKVFNLSHEHKPDSSHGGITVKKPLPPPQPPRRPWPIHEPTLVKLHVDALLEPSRSASEWGAALIRGRLFVAISKGGRCLLCLDWPRALQSRKDAHAVTFELKLEINRLQSEYGGWLGVQTSLGVTRISLEVDERLYIVRMKADMTEVIEGRESFEDAVSVVATMSGCLANPETPISFMGVYDDCIMHTYFFATEDERRRFWTVVGVRVISFAPTESEGEQEMLPWYDDRDFIRTMNRR